MADIKRYNNLETQTIDGDWVKHSDHEAAIKAAVALRDAINQSIMYLGPVAPSCCGCEYEWNRAIEVLKAAIDAARGAAHD